MLNLFGKKSPPAQDKKESPKQSSSVININQAHNYSSSECSYSHQANGSTTCGFDASNVTTMDYNDFMERGFRRCGTYYYKQNAAKSHWVYWTIRMDATQHKIRKSHQKAWNRWQNYLLGKRDIEEKDDNSEEEKKGEAPEKKISEEFLDKVRKSGKWTEELWKRVWEILGGKEAPQGTDKINLFADKKENGVVCSNLVVYFCSQLKANIKDTVKAKGDEIKSAIIIPGFTTSLADGGLVRLTDENIYQSMEEPNKPKPQALITKAKSKEKNDDKLEKKLTPKKFTTKIVKAECTKENFELYKKYCKDIHEKDKESKSGYDRFLCTKGLVYKDVVSQSNPEIVLQLGCFHMNYYIDDELIGVGVIDMVPKGMSSVYFFYDPKYKPLKFGIIGGLYEIDYIKQLNKTFSLFKYYYLGFYIQQTDKMVYKADFEPCELLDPITYRFVTLTPELRKKIDEGAKSLDTVPLPEEEKKEKEFTGGIQEITEFLKVNGRLYDEDTDSVVPFQANSSLEKLIPKIAQLRKDLFEAWGKKLSKRLLMEL